LRILITGAAGKIGSRVVLELAKHGHTVRATDRRTVSADVRAAAEVLYADLTDPLAMLNAVQGCEAVAHIGAIPNPHSLPPDEVLRLNVIGTQNVLEAARAEGIPKESAAAMTRLCGMNTIVIRPPYVMDIDHAKQHGWLRRFPERRGEERDPSLWGYIDVHDQAIAFRLALEKDLPGHHIFFTMADDLTVNATAAELTERHFPQLLPDLDRLTGQTFFDLTPAREQLGFVAERTWRKALEE
jgi:nucleoside-diphosphate-sugar epimerase